MTHADDFVYPGTIIPNLAATKSITLLGPGLRQHHKTDAALVTQAGYLRQRNNIYWVDGAPKRYVPRKGDLVVGVIVRKAGDTLRVDIGSSENASLSLMAFEGATKKQKPDLQTGDVVYARLLTAHREMEPELVCVDKYYKAGILGPLSNDGFVTTISLQLVERILDPQNPLLKTLGKKFAFEVAIGMNGKVWVNARRADDIQTVVNVLTDAEHTSDKDIVRLCNRC